MADKFVTKGTMPTPHERELLIILMEECAEVTQRASKMLRFGIDEVQPGHRLTNAQRLAQEVGDLYEVVERLSELNDEKANPRPELVPWDFIQEGRRSKRDQLDRFLQTTPETAA